MAVNQTFPKASPSAPAPVGVPESVWSEGLSPSIDGPAPTSALDTLIARMLTERDRALAQCGDIFREWSTLPGVTLEQASWLLLQRDPWRPHPDDEAQAQVLGLLHARVLNRLECEVGGLLMPTGRHVPGFTRRFTIVEVLGAGQGCFLADPATAESYGIRSITLDIFGEFLQKSALPPEQKRLILQLRVQTRLQFHRELVATLIADGLARPIPASREGLIYPIFRSTQRAWIDGHRRFRFQDAPEAGPRCISAPISCSVSSHPELHTD